MRSITLGPGTVTFPGGRTERIDSLTITVNGEDVTDQCNIDVTGGTFMLPIRVGCDVT
jgi:hypothetical protein